MSNLENKTCTITYRNPLTEEVIRTDTFLYGSGYKIVKVIPPLGYKLLGYICNNEEFPIGKTGDSIIEENYTSLILYEKLQKFNLIRVQDSKNSLLKGAVYVIDSNGKPQLANIYYVDNEGNLLLSGE